MRVIFLDVDGVLNHSGHTWSDGHRSLDPACVARIVSICARTGARLVISSTWRGSQDGMQRLLGLFGDHIIGVTPHHDLMQRHKEIEKWLLQHRTLPLSFVVVDDDGDAEIPGRPFVQTSPQAGGLTEAHADRIIAFLEAA